MVRKELVYVSPALAREPSVIFRIAALVIWCEWIDFYSANQYRGIWARRAAIPSSVFGNFSYLFLANSLPGPQKRG